MIRRRRWQNAGIKKVFDSVDLQGTSVSELRFPKRWERVLWLFHHQKDLELADIFSSIEQKIRKEADPYYISGLPVREVGGYVAIT